MEHRAAAAPDPVGLRLVVTDQQAVHLEVIRPAAREEQAPERDAGLDGAVLNILADGAAKTRQALREHLAVKNQTLGRTLQRLQDLGQVERCQRGWRLPQADGVPVPAP